MEYLLAAYCTVRVFKLISFELVGIIINRLGKTQDNIKSYSFMSKTLWKIVNNNDLQPTIERSETYMLSLFIYLLMKVTVK